MDRCAGCPWSPCNINLRPTIRSIPRVPRKLTAIMSADVVGYSRMMEADEQGTLARLKANRSAAFDPQVAAFDGRQQLMTHHGK